MIIKGYSPLALVTTCVIGPIATPIFVFRVLDIQFNPILFWTSFVLLILFSGYISYMIVDISIDDANMKFDWKKKSLLSYRNLDKISIKDIKKAQYSDNGQMEHLKVRHKNGIFWMVNFWGDNYSEVNRQLRLRSILTITDENIADKYQTLLKFFVYGYYPLIGILLIITIPIILQKGLSSKSMAHLLIIISYLPVYLRLKNLIKN